MSIWNSSTLKAIGSAFTPPTNDAYDLGSSSLQFKDIYSAGKIVNSTSTVGEGAVLGSAFLGNWNGNSNFVCLAHEENKAVTDNYVFLHGGNGTDTYINALVGRSIFLRYNGSTMVTVGNNIVTLQSGVNMNVVDGNISIATAKAIKVNSIQVVSDQQTAVADAVDASSVILRLNELLARIRTHGLIAT